jgi:putative flippase GtrA
MTRGLPSFRGAATLRDVHHFGGFLLAGILAFAADAAILEGLMRGAEFSPYLARLVGISVGMVVSWFVNRTVTFAIRTRPSVREFAKFAAVSWSVQLVNYAVFAATIAFVPAIPPFVALVFASGIAMFLSYGGFRYAVFGNNKSSAPD